MSLDAPAARTAIDRAVARPLGFVGDHGIDEMAQGIIDIGVAIMAGAIKQITIERGMDPRDFILFPFGGGGPLHAVSLARELGIPAIIIPPQPGNFSALGMLLADARVDESQTFLQDFSENSLSLMAKTFAELEAKVSRALHEEVGPTAIVFERQVEMRYRGQKQATRVLLARGRKLADLRADFNEAYLRRYGHADAEAPVEFVSVLLTALATLSKPDLSQLLPAVEANASQAPRSRSIYFAERGGRIDVPVYQRNHLPVGFNATGPMVIEE
jgi:N-methylhydantoinase A